MAAYDYDPAKVRLTIVAPPVVIPGIEGFAPETFITCSPSVNRFRAIAGIRNQVTRVRNRLRLGRVSFVLEQAAPSNILMTALALADETTHSGIAAIMVKDGNSLVDLAIAPQAWLVEIPTMEKAVRAGNVRWTFECEQLFIIHGGLRQTQSTSDVPFAFEGKDFA